MTDASREPADRRARVARAVEAWVAQLIDLTGRNQLLYYRTLRSGTLELSDADPVALETLLAGGAVRLSQLVKPTDEEPDRFDDAVKKARTVHKKALEHFEERGIDTLSLAYGMATWKTSTTTKSTPAAPVLLHPLELKPRGAAAPDFDVKLQGDWDVNQTLLHLLATEFNTHVAAEPLLELLDGTGVIFDATELFARLAKETADVPDFSVGRRVVVGTFAYTKLPMVRDLKEHVDELAAHDLIAAIAGDGSAHAAVRESKGHKVDATMPDWVPPADEFLIRDADSSQNLVINAAVAGESMVVQGPPGTGKSQTIANLIATLSARGKRVLFVAEKRAAIEAVTRRLEDVGLGGLVMDLHGASTSKKKMAADLARTLDGFGKVPLADVDELHHTLERSRSALSGYAAAMAENRQPWGVTMLQVLERLLGLGEEYETNLRISTRQLDRLDPATVREIHDALIDWAALTAPSRAGTSRWAQEAVTSDGQARDVFALTETLLQDTVPAARRAFDETLAGTALPAPRSVGEWATLFDVLADVAWLYTRVSDDVFDLDLGELASALAPAGRSLWPRMSAQLSDGSYRAAKKQVRQVWAGPDKPSRQACLTALVDAAAVKDAWDELGGTGKPTISEYAGDAADVYEQLEGQLATLDPYLTGGALSDLDVAELTATLQSLVADQQVLFRLPKVNELTAVLTDAELDGLLEGVQQGEVEPDEMGAVFEYAWLSSLRTRLLSSDPRLSGFDGKLQHQHVERFQQADRDHIASAPLRVLRAVAEHAVAAQNGKPDQTQLVNKQARLKRSHMPLRRLFEQAPEVLTALKPCWAMSPLVVSQTLPAAQVFDVVIFDEASQVLPADAVPALLRAPQAIVAGDRWQLPPTPFFGGTLQSDDEEDEEDAAALTSGFESVLDVLDTLLAPSRMLTWHYRSRDERLIAFSNHNIYSGALTTFPGAAVDGCMTHELVPQRPGVRVSSNSNEDEVARVVELMLDHARTRPDETLGVIAMGQEHASRIEAALQQQLQTIKDPEMGAFFDEGRAERTFVKNLERVQGDERDAIILTIGYAKHPDGRMRYNFGPINQPGGQRRLNVAVTRARSRLTVVSSFSHTEMDASKTRSEGADLLRRYLKYAESGGLDLDGAEEQTPLNPFEVDVRHRLERAGLTVIPQYGTSRFRIDFAVPHPSEPGRMVLAVEADGSSYHSSQTARDRDRLRQQVLEAQGWRFCRIWSTDWFNDPDGEVERVVAAYERALVDEDVPAPPVSASAVVSAGLVERGPRPWFAPGRPIGHYSDETLVSLARWVCSDQRLRTEEQIVAELMDVMGFSRRGANIVARLTSAARRAGPRL